MSRPPFQLRCLLLLSAPLLLCAQLGWAAAEPAPEAGTPDPVSEATNEEQAPPARDGADGEEKQGSFIDSAHLFLSSHLVKFIDDVDLFFGDERLDQELPGSFLRLNYGIVANTDGSLDTVSKLRLKADLPRIQEKLNLILESDSEEDTADADPATATSGLTAGSDTYSTALRYIARETSKWNILVDAGLRFGAPPDVFLRNRYRRSVTHRSWHLRLSETLFWYNSKGFGETTEMNIDSRIGWNDLFRATTKATWTRDKDQFDYSQGFSLFHEIDRAHALGLDFTIKAASRPRNHVTSYSYGATFRARTGRDWLFMELRPAASFFEKDDFRMTPTMTLMMEAIVGNI